MIPKLFSHLFLLLLTCISLIYNCNSLQLRGVTIRNWPYADRYENPKEPGEYIYNGFVIDVIDVISNISGFTYDLYFTPDNKYGTVEKDGRINGMLGEVVSGRADFAIADITVTDLRKKYVDFTQPLISFGLSALIQKSNVGDMQQLTDLYHQTDVTYGVIKGGSTYYNFKDSNDITIKSMYIRMTENPDVLIKTMYEGIQRVNNSRFAFIAESPYSEFIEGTYCHLTTLNDNQQHFKFEYAIALHKSSQHLQLFNDAIKQMQESGTLDQLKNKYWTNQCEHHLQIDAAFSINNIQQIFTNTFLLITIQVFVYFSL